MAPDQSTDTRAASIVHPQCFEVIVAARVFLEDVHDHIAARSQREGQEVAVRVRPRRG
ncbi:MAG: hypothetical protein MJD61_03755 [Proteobacteria bacterium]|nr:hypothetical protein [Pseudomonadota bacterium]